MNKSEFNQWFASEFPGYSLKVIEREILGSRNVAAWFSTIDSWDNCPNKIDLNAPNLLVFNFWADRGEFEFGGHSRTFGYKERGVTFRKQRVISEGGFFGKVKLWLLKNKAIIQSMA